MSRMIPPTIDNSIAKLHGESIVFNKFKRLELNENQDFIVIHSLDLPQHVTQKRGEADFIVIAPGRGIFIIEVKGGRIEYKDGVFHYEKRGHKTRQSKNPFTQAKDNMFSIREEFEKKCEKIEDLKEQIPNFKKMLWSFGVIFPHTRWNVQDIESGEEWRTWDADNISESIDRFINVLLVKTKKDFPNKVGPTPNEADIITQIMRQNYECPKLLSASVKQVSEEIAHYTEEQFKALDALSLNDRAVIHGGAGTGKTLIAVEKIKREVQDLKKPLFLCKNRQIVDHVRGLLGDAGYGKLYHNFPSVYTFDSFILHNHEGVYYEDKQYRAKLKELRKRNSQELYSDFFPDYYMKAFEKEKKIYSNIRIEKNNQPIFIDIKGYNKGIYRISKTEYKHRTSKFQKLIEGSKWENKHRISVEDFLPFLEYLHKNPISIEASDVLGVHAHIDHEFMPQRQRSVFLLDINGLEKESFYNSTRIKKDPNNQKDYFSKAEFQKRIENEIEYWSKNKDILFSKNPADLLELDYIQNKHDHLIVDESQDIINNDTSIICLETMVKGGLSNGKWTMFLDPHQGYTTDMSEEEVKRQKQKIFENIKDYGPAFHGLSKNCRNTIQISEHMLKLSTLDQHKIPYGPSGIESDIPVEYRFYDNKREITDLLNKDLKKTCKRKSSRR